MLCAVDRGLQSVSTSCDIICPRVLVGCGAVRSRHLNAPTPDVFNESSAYRKRAVNTDHARATLIRDPCATIAVLGIACNGQPCPWVVERTARSQSSREFSPPAYSDSGRRRPRGCCYACGIVSRCSLSLCLTLFPLQQPVAASWRLPSRLLQRLLGTNIAVV